MAIYFHVKSNVFVFLPFTKNMSRISQQREITIKYAPKTCDHWALGRKSGKSLGNLSSVHNICNDTLYTATSSTTQLEVTPNNTKSKMAAICSRTAIVDRRARQALKSRIFMSYVYYFLREKIVLICLCFHMRATVVERCGGLFYFGFRLLRDRNKHIGDSLLPPRAPCAFGLFICNENWFYILGRCLLRKIKLLVLNTGTKIIEKRSSVCRSKWDCGYQVKIFVERFSSTQY